MNPAPPFSVIIPAHNEAAVIGRCLSSIGCGDSASGDMEVIVVANGCSDGTADAARKAAPNARVLEVAEGSKTGAINAGLKAAKHCPVIVLDADVECDFKTLAALAAEVSQAGVMTAAPAIKLDLLRASSLMKRYYRAWLGQPYARSGNGGAGCYAMSCEAIQKVGEFPSIIADDLWIHSQFPDGQRRYVTQDASGQPVFTIVRPPQTVREQVSVEARRRIGVTEFRKLGFASEGRDKGISEPTSLLDMCVFAAIKLAARLLARWRILRGRSALWARDTGSRQNV